MAAKEESFENKEKWGFVEANMRNVMRLRHMSYSTEKTYLMWVRLFYGFLAGKNPDDLMELGVNQSGAVKEFASKTGFGKIKFVKDYASIKRIFIGELN